LQLTVKPASCSQGFHRINQSGNKLVDVLARGALKRPDIEARVAGRNPGQDGFCSTRWTSRSRMVEHVVRLAQAGALQNSQSPGVAVVDGDGNTVEPPPGSALVSIAHMPKEINVSLVNWVAAQFKLVQLPGERSM
jgi:hypothetical protein